MPEQAAVQRDLKLRPFLCGAAQGLVQCVGVDLLLQRAGNAKNARVPHGCRGQKHLGDIVNFVPGIGHGFSSFLNDFLHEPPGAFHRHGGAVDGHLLKNMPALGVDLQLGIDAGLLQAFHQPLTVGLQDLIRAHLH